MLLPEAARNGREGRDIGAGRGLHDRGSRRGNFSDITWRRSTSDPVSHRQAQEASCFDHFSEITRQIAPWKPQQTCL